MPGGLETPHEADPDYDNLPDLISCADDDLNDLDDKIEDNFCYYQSIHNMVAEAIERMQANPKTLHKAQSCVE